jgi:hypothetical protein
MRTLTSVVLVALLAGCDSPSGNPPARVDPPVSAGKSRPPESRQPMPTVAAQPQTSAGARSPAINVPAGARFTIFCTAIVGVDHVQRANQLKAQLVGRSGLSDWYVVHADGQSSIYYGFYSEIDASVVDRDARQEAARAQADRQRIEQVRDPDWPDRRIFARSLIVPLDAPNPTAPPEWNLSNAKGFWSVQVAAYTGGPERKQAAVESVREARKMGIEAYYHHGESISSVCIGSWPVDAVRRQDAARAGATTDDPSETIVIAHGGMPVPQELRDQLLDQGRDVTVYESKVDIADPTLVRTIQEYSALGHSTNGSVDMMSVNGANGRQIAKPKPALLVQVPRGETQPVAGDAAAPDTFNRAQRNLGARLREIGQ